MRATLLLGILMAFSTSTHKVAGSPNLDTLVDDQDFGGSGDYSDYRTHDHRGAAHQPHYDTPTTTAPPTPHDSGREAEGGILDATNVATYDDEDYGPEDYGSGDYDDENYYDEYDNYGAAAEHAAEDTTSTTSTTTTTTTPPPAVTTTTQPPPPPPPPVVVVSTTSSTTSTTPPPPPTTAAAAASTTSPPPSSIIEENGIYDTDEERLRNKDKHDQDYGYDDEYDNDYNDEDYVESYDDEDYGGGGEGSGAGGVAVGPGHHPPHHGVRGGVVDTSEDLGPHHRNEGHGGARGGEDHFTFDRVPIEEVEEDLLPHHHEPAPPRTDNEIWFNNNINSNLTTGHTDSRVPEDDDDEEEEEDDDIYDDSDPYGRRRPVDQDEGDLAVGPGDDHYEGAGNMDGSVQIVTHKEDERQVSIFAQPGILAAFIGGAVVGLLCAILLVMFVVYRMRKKDEGSYPLDEPKRLPLTSSYATTDKEIYA